MAEDQYPVNVKGKKMLLPTEVIGELVKKKMRQSPVIMELFNQFEVSPDRLDELQIVIVPMEDKHAETDNETMKINSSLFQDGTFFNEHFFVVAHEIVHWLSRQREEVYFADPEEVLGFVSAIAFELEQHGDMDIVFNRIYPKISWHFHNEADAKDFFGRMVEKAKKIIRSSKGTDSHLLV